MTQRCIVVPPSGGPEPTDPYLCIVLVFDPSAHNHQRSQSTEDENEDEWDPVLSPCIQPIFAHYPGCHHPP
ncbi:hypothetical protein [Prosthecobacter sp.]|uniref:hypothetical protein n=1 Tax=Prosthecobacter sp. TaxID=1965333 RepID=UPI0025D7ABD8|nr:hypothetical protein [Prosthecobacter sp.]